MSEGNTMLKAHEIMSCPVITSHEDDDLKSIATKMKKYDIACVVILNNSEKPTGVVTQGDIIKRVAEKPKGAIYKMKAKNIMSKPLRYIEERQDLEDAARLMMKYKIKRLCVLDREKKLVGIITDNDVMKNALFMVDIANATELIGEMINNRDR